MPFLLQMNGGHILNNPQSTGPGWTLDETTRTASTSTTTRTSQNSCQFASLIFSKTCKTLSACSWGTGGGKLLSHCWQCATMCRQQRHCAFPQITNNILLPTLHQMEAAVRRLHSRNFATRSQGYDKYKTKMLTKVLHCSRKLETQKNVCKGCIAQCRATAWRWHVEFMPVKSTQKNRNHHEKNNKFNTK